MTVTREQVLEALRSVPYPGFTRDLVSFGVVGDVEVSGARVRCVLTLGPGNPAVASQVEDRARAAVEALAGVEAATIEVRAGGAGASSGSLPVVGQRRPSVAARGSVDRRLIPDVRRTVAVASGKGGVGKSTVAVNLAVALARSGWRVGLLDADIYGPSVPIMAGLRDARPQMDPATRKLQPFERHGVRFMSLGFLVDPDTAVIWRGPMVMKALEQLLGDVDWGELDLLVVDMPPGTGDAQLTISQRIQLTGAVIVTTPQDVALADAIKGVAMFRKVEVPVLGIVENMSFFNCPHCSSRTDVFGHGGGRREAKRLDVPFLGEIPLDPGIRSSGDDGTPVTASAPDSPLAAAFLDIAAGVRSRLEPADGVAADSEASGGLFRRFRKMLSGSDE